MVCMCKNLTNNPQRVEQKVDSFLVSRRINYVYI